MCLTSCSKIDKELTERESSLPHPGETSIVKFDQLFLTEGVEQYVLRQSISIGGLELGKGIGISSSISINGIQLEKLRNKKLSVMNRNGVFVITETL